MEFGFYLHPLYWEISLITSQKGFILHFKEYLAFGLKNNNKLFNT